MSHREGSLKVITEREREGGQRRIERKGNGRSREERENKVLMNASLKNLSSNQPTLYILD